METFHHSNKKSAKQFHQPARLCSPCFGTCKGILQKFQPHGENVNAVSYCTTLQELRQANYRKRPGLLTKGVILLDDHACPHTAKVTQELLRTFHWDRLEHPPYSPDLAPSDFHLFRSLKEIIWMAVILQMMMP